MRSISLNLDAPSGQDNSTQLYLLGGSAGFDFGGGMSLELALHRVDSLESQMPDPDPVWVVVPTFGFRR